MQKQLKNGNFYLGIAVLMMLVLFISSSMTYQSSWTNSKSISERTAKRLF